MILIFSGIHTQHVSISIWYIRSNSCDSFVVCDSFCRRRSLCPSLLCPSPPFPSIRIRGRGRGGEAGGYGGLVVGAGLEGEGEGRGRGIKEKGSNCSNKVPSSAVPPFIICSAFPDIYQSCKQFGESRDDIGEYFFGHASHSWISNLFNHQFRVITCICSSTGVGHVRPFCK